ncbi:hypothetical protein [Mycolicibacterium sphagni]|uniref:Uncharacterized protein n=1 Tax=Mycolicibacterium sphagni TaxID=1786 RepID=A0A255DQK1_9MYCO|nr:hypothetical protein [Mycolicibacterium sphagni]OYN81727.1 hypothetical protein CG716_05065 [Mycolicibacterium sphagni]
MSTVAKTTKQNGTVTLEFPEQLAPFVKIGLKNIGVKLAQDDQFHTNDKRSLSASVASIGLADIYDSMTQAGVFY